MRPLLSEFKQKIFSTVLATIVTLIGFEIINYILGRTYQLRTFAWVSLYVYIFHFLWLTFLFDLHFKKRGVLAYFSPDHKGLMLFYKAFQERIRHMMSWHHFRHYLNFLILPGIVYWSAILLMAINPFDERLKHAVIIISTICLSVIYYHFKEIFRKNFELHDLGFKVLSMVKLCAIYLFYAAIIGYTFYFGFSARFLFFGVLIGTYLLIYQALFQHRLLGKKVFWPTLAIALVTAAVSFWVYNVWNHLYLTAGLLVLAVYNTCWGILHHYWDKNLTKKLAIEYLLLLFLVLSILLASHDFTTRVQ